MNEQDAITLLQKVSGCHGDGCQQLVDILDRVPLAIARYLYSTHCSIFILAYINPWETAWTIN